MIRPFKSRTVPKLASRVVLLLLGTISLAWFVISFASWSQSGKLIVSPLVESKYPDVHLDIQGGERRLAIVVPANNPSPDLCKVIASAMALGYPTPILVNWAKDFSHAAGGKWGPFLGKITGALDYMDQITHADTNASDRLNDDDLILIVDAYDVWFQLPPEILLHRYHGTIKRANMRLMENWGSTDPMPMKQTILISAQKRCYPTIKSGSNLHCDDLPESELRADLYGAKTDTGGDYYHNFRPRWLNSGSFLGPVGDMKRYFRRVKERMERQIAKDTQFEGDQGVFGEIFGEQEVWRKWRQEQHSRTMFSSLGENEGLALMQQEFEFHVALDYSQNLFLPTVYAERDGAFVSLGNQSTIENHLSKLGISSLRQQLTWMPRDLAETQNPLTKVLPKRFSTAIGWEEMPLYLDFYTTAIPVVLHHNAWKNGVKDRRTKWWDQTWFFPFLREMLEARLEPGKLSPLATIPTQDSELTYYAPKSDEHKRKPRIFEKENTKEGLEEIELNTVCRYPDETESSEKHWFDEVFRDGKGHLA